MIEIEQPSHNIWIEVELYLKPWNKRNIAIQFNKRVFRGWPDSSTAFVTSQKIYFNYLFIYPLQSIEHKKGGHN